jgi:hypothetical protein
MLLKPSPRDNSGSLRVQNSITPHGVFVNQTSVFVSESATPAIFPAPGFDSSNE